MYGYVNVRTGNPSEALDSPGAAVKGVCELPDISLVLGI